MLWPWMRPNQSIVSSGFDRLTACSSLGLSFGCGPPTPPEFGWMGFEASCECYRVRTSTAGIFLVGMLRYPGRQEQRVRDTTRRICSLSGARRRRHGVWKDGRLTEESVGVHGWLMMGRGSSVVPCPAAVSE